MEFEFKKWDGVQSWYGRFFHCCPICLNGPGVTTPMNADGWAYAHPWCVDNEYPVNMNDASFELARIMK